MKLAESGDPDSQAFRLQPRSKRCWFPNQFTLHSGTPGGIRTHESKFRKLSSDPTAGALLIYFNSGPIE